MNQIPGQLDDVGAGWHPLLIDLHAKLVDVAPTYFVAQLKEKFGTLRLYVGTPTEVFDEVNALISAAEQVSAVTCEFCGKPGTQRQTGLFGWIKTMCDDCGHESEMTT